MRPGFNPYKPSGTIVALIQYYVRVWSPEPTPEAINRALWTGFRLTCCLFSNGNRGNLQLHFAMECTLDTLVRIILEIADSFIKVPPANLQRLARKWRQFLLVEAHVFFRKLETRSRE